MKMQTSRSGAKCAHFLSLTFAMISLFIASSDCTAQTVQQIVVQGKDTSWRLVGTVDPLTAFQIDAKGSVDFGGLFHNDNANAGVTGNAFAKVAEDIFSSGIKALIEYLLSADVSDDTAVGSTSSGLSSAAGSPAPIHWNWVDYINEVGKTVNYDEGAFFIVMTTSDQQPKEGNSVDTITEPALYYWYKKIFENSGNIAYDKKVWVWAKVHDGGRNPFSTSSFGDNKGSYTIWIDPDQAINDVAMKASVARPAFKNTEAASRLKSLAAAKMAGRNYHATMILSRRSPKHQPSP